MSILAFLLDVEAWHYSAADLMVPGFLCVPAIITPICCYLIAKDRRLVGHAVVIAGLPAFAVSLRLFFAILQYGLREFPDEQKWMAVIVGYFPFIPIAVMCAWPEKKKPNQPLEPTPTSRGGSS
jgi:hypothetical protein